MYLVLAALASSQRDAPRGPAAGPLLLIAAAVQTLLANPADFVNAVTLTQPVSSPEEAAVITATVRLLAFEHHLAVEVSDRDGHLRLRLARDPTKQEPTGAQE